MADYLEAYAKRFALDVRNGVTVERLSRDDGRFVLTCPDGTFTADNVIVATGSHRTPRTPDFAAELDPRIVQLHSSVLVVGLGNSGAEIAYELIRTRATVVAGQERGEIPVQHGSVPSRFVLPVIRFLGHRVLTRGTPVGRKVGPKIAAGGPPLIRIKTKHLTEAGVERGGRVVGTQDGLPLLDDGRVLDVANVIWCTGFRENFSWIAFPISKDGTLVHDRGVAAEPGLYFVGLIFQYSITSDVLPGVGRDAARVAKHLATTASHSHRVVAGVDIEDRPRHVLGVVGEEV